MQFKNVTPDTVAELLEYLADREDFNSLSSLKNLTKNDVKNIFKELADHLREVSLNQPIMSKESVKDRDMSDNMSKVIAKLSPQEENTLFKSFRIS